MHSTDSNDSNTVQNQVRLVSEEELNQRLLDELNLDQNRTNSSSGKPVIYITNSERSTFLDCQKKWYYEYVRRLTPKKTPIYFTWGDYVHQAADGREQGISPVETAERLRCEIEEEATRTPISAKELHQKECMLELLPIVCDAHLLVYKGDQDYETIAAEKTFELPLGDNIILRGKIDRIVRHVRTGVIHPWEIKTPGQTGPSYYERLKFDAQMQTYLFASHEGLGYDMTDYVYDVWKKPQEQNKFYEDESPQAYAERVGNVYLTRRHDFFQRWTEKFSTDIYEHARRELFYTAQMMRDAKMRGYYIMHHPGNRIGGCSFAPLCEFGEGSHAERYYNVRVNHNPELNPDDVESW